MMGKEQGESLFSETLICVRRTKNDQVWRENSTFIEIGTDYELSEHVIMIWGGHLKNLFDIDLELWRRSDFDFNLVGVCVLCRFPSSTKWWGSSGRGIRSRGTGQASGGWSRGHQLRSARRSAECRSKRSPTWRRRRRKGACFGFQCWKHMLIRFWEIKQKKSNLFHKILREIVERNEP